MFYIYNTITGQIRSIFTGPVDFLESQLQANEEYLESVENATDATHYVDVSSKTLLEFPVKINKYQEFNWEFKEWETPAGTLELAKIDGKTEVNTLAGITILEKYPTYRQTNYNREPTAPATIEMNLWIDAIRAESNIATSSIDSATDLATIEGIVDGFKAYLAGL
jgi:hypothetical protein